MQSLTMDTLSVIFISLIIFNKESHLTKTQKADAIHSLPGTLVFLRQGPDNGVEMRNPTLSGGQDCFVTVSRTLPGHFSLPAL